MTKFIIDSTPKPTLEVVYISHEAKEWIRQQSKETGASMVKVVDEMMKFCQTNQPTRRPNVLHAED